MKSDQTDSDPLPYTQVDRAVKPKVALLAGRLGVTTQHALGSLVEFWDLNGDPREIESLLLAGKEEVILKTDEVRRRFLLASGGKDIDPAELATLGLVEPRGADFRVRGMSRYFAPLKRRLQARDAAKAGGAARAKGKRGAGGRFEGGGAPAGGQLELSPPGHHPAATRQPADTPPDDQPTDQPATTTAGSGQRTAVIDGQKLAHAARAPRETDLLCDDFKEIVGKKYQWLGAKDGALFAKLRKEHSLEEIRTRWRAGLNATDRWLKIRTVAQLVQKWNDLADVGLVRPAPRKPGVPIEPSSQWKPEDREGPLRGEEVTF